MEGKPSLAPSTPKAPVTRVIDAILAFLPSGCGLFSQDKALRADWEEFGVAFAPATPNDLLRFGLDGEGWLKAEAEGYRIKTFKINKGQCYEIYGTKDGKKTEAWFNPETGASLGAKSG